MSSDNDDYINAENSSKIESLDDLPTDDSVSLGSSSSSDDSSSDDVTQGRPQKVAVSYDQASSSSDDSSSDESSDDSSDDAVEQQTNHAATRAHVVDTDSDDSNNMDDLQNVSLEERLQMKQQAGVSVNRTRERERKNRALQVASERLVHQQQQQSNTTTTTKKKSKHKPTEVSSKRRDYFSRGAPTLDSSGVGIEVTAHRYKPRDPRMSDAVASSGTSASHDDKYDFLQEIRDNEIASLKKTIAVQKLGGKKGQKARKKLGIDASSLKHNQEELKRLLQEKASYDRAQVDRAAKMAVKRQLKQQVASGKGVYYLKKRELRKLEQEQKFEELRKRGGNAAVDKALAKRRKKNKSKDTGYFIPKDV